MHYKHVIDEGIENQTPDSILDEVSSSEVALGELSPTARGKKIGLVDLAWFVAEVDRKEQAVVDRKENHLDFYKKYNGLADHEGTPEEPTISLGACLPSWCLVFDLFEDADGEHTKVSKECVDTCQRLWAAGLDLDSEISTSGCELFITVGASYEILVHEANHQKPRMRMKHCKGSIEFASHLIPHLTPCMFDENVTKQTVFTSGLRQRLVWSRMTRIAGYDPDEMNEFLPKEAILALMKSKIKRHRPIKSRRIKELMATHGGFRANVQTIMGDEVGTLAEQCLADPYFIATPTHKLTKREQAMIHAQEAHMRHRGLDPVQYTTIEKAVEQLVEWTSKEPGKSEVYVGSLTTFFPVHDPHELEYLQQEWGTYHLILQPYIRGKTLECRTSNTYFEESLETKHLSMFWCPIDTIRDYFGDHIGLYIAWLSLYVKALVAPAALGLLVFFASAAYTVNDNPLILPYSVFLCMWSACFNIAWARQENELKFLWGSENSENVAPVRRQFVGAEQLNDKTGKEEIVHPNPSKRVGAMVVSTAFSMVLIAIVAFSAFSASMVRFYNMPTICAIPGPNDDFPNIDDFPRCARCEIKLMVKEAGNSSAYYTAAGQMVEDKYVVTGENGPLAWEVPEIKQLYKKSMCDDTVKYPVMDKNGTSLARQWNDGYPEQYTSFQKNQWKYMSSFMNLLLINIFGFLYRGTAIKLNDWENHRTQIEYDDNLILKNFSFQFINNYFILFYIAYMRQIPTEWSGFDVDAECNTPTEGSCLNELQVQLIAVFTTKMLIGQVLEAFKPQIKTCLKQARLDMKLNELSKSIDDFTDLTSNAVKKAAAGDDMEAQEKVAAQEAAQEAKEEKQRKNEERRRLREEASSETEMETMSYAEVYENTFDDFSEMAIQFGYLALFSPIYPLAPLLALGNNIVELRVDATYLCYMVRRPRWEVMEDIGNWFTVFQTIGFLAVITNATMITFVGQQMADTEEEKVGGLAARMENWQLWAVAVGVEHAVMISRLLIMLIVPRMPRWLASARDELEHHMLQMKPAAVIAEEVKLHDEYLKKYGQDVDHMVDESEYNCNYEDVIIAGASPTLLKVVNNFRQHLVQKRVAAPAQAAKASSAAAKSTDGTDEGAQKFVNPVHVKEDSEEEDVVKEQGAPPEKVHIETE